MNPFYDKFPDTVDVNGKSYRIHTDFREFLFLIDLLESDVEDIVMAEAILGIYKDEIPPDYKQAMNAIADFVTDSEPVENEKEKDKNKDREKKKLISYSKDAPYIIGDFIRFYHIDLTSCRYLHWKKFQLLLTGLSEDSETKKRIGYRSINPGKIKNNDERKRIIEIQRRISIEDEEADEGRIGELFGGMME